MRLGGWWRLWIVLTLLFGGYVTLVAINDGDGSVFEATKPTFCVPGTFETKTIAVSDLKPWEAYQRTPADMLARGELLDPKHDVEQYRCVTWLSLIVRWAFVLGLAFAVVGLVFVARWIIAGFRKQSV